MAIHLIGLPLPNDIVRAARTHTHKDNNSSNMEMTFELSLKYTHPYAVCTIEEKQNPCENIVFPRE